MQPTGPDRDDRSPPPASLVASGSTETGRSHPGRRSPECRAGHSSRATPSGQGERDRSRGTPGLARTAFGSCPAVLEPNPPPAAEGSFNVAGAPSQGRRARPWGQRCGTPAPASGGNGHRPGSLSGFSAPRQTSAPAVLHPDALAEMATPGRERPSALRVRSNLSRITGVQGAPGRPRTHRPTAVGSPPAPHPPAAVRSPGPAHSRAPRRPAGCAASRAPAAACSRVLAGAEARQPHLRALGSAEGARGAGARGSGAGGDGDAASPAPRRGQRDRWPGHEAGGVHPHPLGARASGYRAGEPSGAPAPAPHCRGQAGARLPPG